MRLSISRVLVVAFAGLWLGGCVTSNPLAKLTGNGAADPAAGSEAMAWADPNGAAPALGVAPEDKPGLLGGDPYDALSLGKKQYRAGNYGLAEQQFRKAVELHPRDGEAWLGLAACYDELRRFDLADRAYNEAIRIDGRTPAILNNLGYSYMLRGDYARARATLMQAQVKDPNNKFVTNNLRLLQQSARLGKAIE